MNELKRKTFLRRSTKQNQINIHIDSMYDDSRLKNGKMLTLPKTLSNDEKKYLLAVRNGDLNYVKKMIHNAYKFQTININCVDSLGRGALNLAIESENLEMVELLIVMGVEPKDALLHAINAEFVEAVELLLEYEEIIYKEGEKYSWEKVDWNTAVFTPDITPLILAAHKNNFEIIKILLDRGVTLPIPHNIGCNCSVCMYESSTDSLRYSMSRVNEYRALASSSLISISSSDPILTAFKLSWRLRNLAAEENECQEEYTELRKQCQQFAVNLLDQVRSSEELEIILNHNQQCENGSFMPGSMYFPLLHTAIKYNQKKFIAHPHVQQLLSKMWYDGLPGFRSKSIIYKTFDVIIIAISFPIYCVAYVLFPNSDLGKTIEKPIMKFLVHVTSYLCFLGVLILVSQRAEVQAIELLGTERMKQNLKKAMEKQRGNSPTFFEWCALIYVIGYMKQQYCDIKKIGLEKCLKNSMWNIMELVKNSIYMMVILLRIYAYVRERVEIKSNPGAVFVPREKWNMFDPQLIAEGLFATANILSAFKLIHICSINSHLGPLQISIGRMFIDIIKFFSIYVLILFSFACGLNQLLWYYVALERKNCYILPNDTLNWETATESCSKWQGFGNLFETIQTLFWTGFGEVGVDSFNLTGIKSYTRFWALLMFAAYSVLNVTILLNLLIAMMSNSYSIIQEQADTEWKFARTKLWLDCFENIAALPSPYNLIPTKHFLCELFVCNTKNNNGEDDSRKENSENKTSITTKKKFSQVIQALVWRYISSKHRQYEINAVTEDHIQEIKSDISSVKYQILDVLKKNGMEIPSENKKDRILSKKLRVWERQLIRDFHVGLIVKNDFTSSCSSVDESGDSSEKSSKSSKKKKFKNAVRKLVKNTASHKWKQTINDACKAAQIGHYKTEESLKKQSDLQKAMNEIKNFTATTPTPTSPDTEYKYVFPPSRPTLLNLLQNSELQKDQNLKTE